jgi:hypothetical protein
MELTFLFFVYLLNKEEKGKADITEVSISVNNILKLFNHIFFFIDLCNLKLDSLPLI